MSEYTQPPADSGLFEEFQAAQYEPATRWQRFFNLFIDNLFMQFAMGYLSGYLLGKLLNAIAPEFLYKVVYDEEQIDVLLFSYMLGIINWLLYYTICEKAFKGHTLGKLVTGTRAIRNDGQELTFKDALLRSLSRLVPFEAFSGFGTPWHDKWTNTTVIKTR